MKLREGLLTALARTRRDTGTSVRRLKRQASESTCYLESKDKCTLRNKGKGIKAFFNHGKNRDEKEEERIRKKKKREERKRLNKLDSAKEKNLQKEKAKQKQDEKINKVAEKLETRLMDDIKEDLMMGIMMDDMDSSSPRQKDEMILVFLSFCLLKQL